MAREVIGDKQESEMVSTAMLCGSLWLKAISQGKK